MKKEEYISTVLSQMLDKTQKPFVEREISDHIDDRIDYYSSAGYSADESEEKAVEHMGDAVQLGFRMNLLYDNRKYNRLSLICLIMIAINAILIPVAFFASESMGKFVISYVFSIVIEFSYISCGFFTLLFVSIEYLLCSKTKNHNHLIALGLLSLLYYFPVWLSYLLFEEYSLYDDQALIQSINGLLGILTDNKFYTFITVFKGITLLTGIITAIMSLGFGLYVYVEIKGKSKTKSLSRYQRFRFVPITVFAVYYISTIVFEILMMNGVFLDV